jgi:hypothetical protein
MTLHIDELVNPNKCCAFTLFELNKEMAKAIFDVSHQKYCCRTDLKVHQHPYLHYEITAYVRPVGDEVDVFESTDGTNWSKTN